MNLIEDFKDFYDLYNLWKNYQDIKSKRKKKRKSIRAINRSREDHGYFNVTFLKMKTLNSGQFFIHTRMNRETFEWLLSMCKSVLVRSSKRAPICPESRLALTVLYLSQAESFQSIACSWKLGKETVRSIIYETCDALWEVLSPIYVAEPNSTALSTIAEDFWRFWDMPNCIGAVDGKHIALVKVTNSGSEFLNYKKHHSIVLMAACDARYTFTYIDVGAYGSQTDGGIFQASSFGRRILRQELPIPGLKSLPNSHRILPHFFVADSAFPLHPNIMKPFPGVNLNREKEIYNKRISRARRMIENSFGILVARWRILHTTLHMLPTNAEKIVLACVALHNFLRLNSIAENYVPPNYVDWEDEDENLHEGLWRTNVGTNIASIAPSRNIHVYNRMESNNVRNELCMFVNNEGAKSK